MPASWLATADLAGRVSGESLVIALGILVVVGLIAALLHPGAVRADKARIEADLEARGALALEIEPASGAGDKNEAGYEATFRLADGSVQRARCKTSSATGVWWQGNVPWSASAPPAPEPAPQPPVRGASERALVPEGELERLAESLPVEDHELAGAELPLEPVETLLARLRSGEPETCREAVERLARHGPAILPRLEQALEDPDPDVRIDVRRAIDRIRAAAT